MMSTKNITGILILLVVVVGGVFLANWLAKKMPGTTSS